VAGIENPDRKNSNFSLQILSFPASASLPKTTDVTAVTRRTSRYTFFAVKWPDDDVDSGVVSV
jgi:hypothetical protein